MTQTIKKKGLSMSLANLKSNEEYLGETQNKKNLIQSIFGLKSKLSQLSAFETMKNSSTMHARSQNSLQERLIQEVRQKERHGRQKILTNGQNRRQIISLGKGSSSISKKIQQGTSMFCIQPRKSLPFFKSEQIIHNVQIRPLKNEQIVYYRIQVSGQKQNLKEKGEKEKHRNIDKQNNESKIKKYDKEDDRHNNKDNFFKKDDDILKKKLGYSKRKLVSDLSLIPDFHIRKQLKGIDTNKAQTLDSEPIEKSETQKLKQKASEFEIEKLLEIQNKIEGLIVKSRK